jgi:hypothetical protein
MSNINNVITTEWGIDHNVTLIICNFLSLPDLVSLLTATAKKGEKNTIFNKALQEEIKCRLEKIRNSIEKRNVLQLTEPLLTDKLKIGAINYFNTKDVSQPPVQELEQIDYIYQCYNALLKEGAASHAKKIHSYKNMYSL